MHAAISTQCIIVTDGQKINRIIIACAAPAHNALCGINS